MNQNTTVVDTPTAEAKSAPEPTYKLVINDNVVAKVAAKAAQKIDGIVDMKGSLFSTIQEGLGGSDKTKGVDADVIDEKNAKISLNVIMEYGKSAPEMFYKIKEVVIGDLKDMTGLDIVEMIVNVVDVMTQEEYAQRLGASNHASDES